MIKKYSLSPAYLETAHESHESLHSHYEDILEGQKIFCKL